MKLKTQFSAADFFLILLAILFPFAADMRIPLVHGKVVEWVENGQALWLLFGAIFTAIYMKPLSLEKGARQFWLWSVIWWLVLFGRSISWGRDYFPEESKILFRTISVLLIAALVLPVILSSVLRHAITLRIRNVYLPLWMSIIVLVTFLIADSVEHHRFLSPIFLHDVRYTDLMEELYENIFMIGLFIVSRDIMKNDKKYLHSNPDTNMQS